jgi:hypothetical protein
LKDFYYLILLFAVSLSAFAQNNISGKIIDTYNLPITSASVTLKSEDGSILAYTYSDEFGKYDLQSKNTGTFLLSVNAMGFEQKSTSIIFNKISEKILFDFTLSSKITQLNEVIIQTARPITIDGDKVTYDVKSFLQGNEQVVEDLLKKIPGLNVEADGTIKVGNQEVEKIMIDGDDMFEKGYKILTKNMPVNPLDKVELLQRYSNNKHLKGIENSDKVALNLVLKEDAKRVWFGNVSLGYGLASENRYEVRANLMNFGKKNKFYFLTNLNNIGIDATGDVNDLIRPFRFGEPGSIGDNESANTLLGLGNSQPNLKQKRVNLNNSEMLSLNSIFTISEKVKLKALGFLNTDENDFFRNSFESFFVGNTTFENTEDYVGRKAQITGF